MDWVVCPQCRQPAEVTDRAELDSTDGLIAHAHVRCLLRHWFVLPVELLTAWPEPALHPLGDARTDR